MKVKIHQNSQIPRKKRERNKTETKIKYAPLDKHERRICFGGWGLGFPGNSRDGKVFWREKAKKRIPDTAMAVAKTTPCEERIEDIFLDVNRLKTKREKITEKRMFG